MVDDVIYDDSPRKILLIGPSGVGKSYCVKMLSSAFSACDMDQIINTRRGYKVDELEKLVDILRHNKSHVIAVSVIKPFLTRLLTEKCTDEWKAHFSCVVYLKTVDKSKHKIRLVRKPTIGTERTQEEISVILGSIQHIDGIFSQLADVIIDVDQLDEEGLFSAVEQIVADITERQSRGNVMFPEFLTRQQYDSKTRLIGGPHWGVSAGSRWAYHNLAVSWAKELRLTSAENVLEMGTMGVPIVYGSHSIDYDVSKNNKDWVIHGYAPTYIHDGRITPWPFEDKRYKLFIALRVFHHLVPKQRDCFNEAKRISRSMIMVVPSKKVHPRGIDRDELTVWNSGIEPYKEHHFDGELGSCYFWKWSACSDGRQ